MLLRKGGILQQLVSITQNQHQHVVEVVGYAACQASYGVHLLRLTKFVFNLPAVSDITKTPHPADHLVSHPLRLRVSLKNTAVLQRNNVETHAIRMVVKIIKSSLKSRR